MRSQSFKTTEGVKQGGVISPHLFNFFINGLVTEIKSMNVGALLGDLNVSIVAYCDDIILVSSSEKHMRMMLESCERYAGDWKLEYNPLKSVAYSSMIGVLPVFHLKQTQLPCVDGFLYLSLPIGDDDFTFKFFEEKMTRVERSFYSLKGLGCRPEASNLNTIAFLYKQ